MLIITKGKKRFYKPKPMTFQKEDVKNMELIIHNGANCDCEAATNNSGKALLIGSKHGNIFNVTYISAWSKSKEFKKAVRAIRKKHDCKKEIESIANANNGGLSTEGKHVPGEDEALSKIESNEIGKGRGNRKKGKGKDRGKKKNRGRKKKGKKKDVNAKGNKENDNNVQPVDPMANFGKDFICWELILLSPSIKLIRLLASPKFYSRLSKNRRLIPSSEPRLSYRQQLLLVWTSQHSLSFCIELRKSRNIGGGGERTTSAERIENAHCHSVNTYNEFCHVYLQ